MLKYNFLLNFSLMMLILTIPMSLSFNDLLIIWFILEINNFLFIYILSTLKNKKIIFFYFFIQISSSIILILSLTMNYIMININNIFTYLFLFSLMIKLGIPPFHFWMIMFSNHISYFLLSIFLTIQKFIPFYMLTLNSMINWLYLTSILLCSFIPPIMSMNLMNIKKIMAYSSINQMGWMIMLTLMKKSLWLIYMLIYSFTFILIMTLLTLNNIYSYMFINNNMFNNLIYLFMMLNIASMPPFSFFFMKWTSIYIMMSNQFNFLMMMLMMLSSMIMLYIYLNIINLTLFMNIFSNKLLIFKKFNFLFLFKFWYSSLIYLFMFLLLMFFLMM